MAKIAEAQNRLFKNIYVCKKCQTKIRAEPQKILKGKELRTRRVLGVTVHVEADRNAFFVISPLSRLLLAVLAGLEYLALRVHLIGVTHKVTERGLHAELILVVLVRLLRLVRVLLGQA